MANVPALAQTSRRRLSFLDSDAKKARSVTAQVVKSGGNYFLFPIFVIGEAKVSFGVGAEIPLIGRNGKLNIRKDINQATIRIKVLDFRYSISYAAITEALNKVLDQTTGNRNFLDPDFLAEDWEATLEVRDIRTGGKYVAVGKPGFFSRNPNMDYFNVYINVDNSEGSFQQDLLTTTVAENMRLRLTGKYKAEVTSTDYSIYGEQISEDKKIWINNVISGQGRQSDLFVLIGGDVRQNYNVKEIYRQAQNIVIKTRQGTTVPTEQVNAFVSKMLDQFEVNVKLKAEDAKKIVTFLLDNNIRIDTPIGEVTRIRDYFKDETEKRTRDLIDSLSKGSTKISDHIDANASVIGLGSGGGAWDRSSSSDWENKLSKLSERFKRDVTEIDQVYEGRSPKVAAMTLEQMQEINSGSFLTTLISKEVFYETEAKFTDDISFNDPEITGYAEPPRDFQLAVKDYISASYNQFSKIRGEVTGRSIPGPAVNAIHYVGSNSSRKEQDKSSWTYSVTRKFPGEKDSWIEHAPHLSIARCVLHMQLDDDRDLKTAEAYYRQLVDHIDTSLPPRWEILDESRYDYVDPVNAFSVTNDKNVEILNSHTAVEEEGTECAWLQVLLLYSKDTSRYDVRADFHWGKPPVRLSNQV